LEFLHKSSEPPATHVLDSRRLAAINVCGASPCYDKCEFFQLEMKVSEQRKQGDMCGTDKTRQTGYLLWRWERMKGLQVLSSTESLCSKNLSDRFREYRYLVVTLSFKYELLQIVQAQMDNCGASIVQLRNQGQKDLGSKIGRPDEIQIEIDELEKQRSAEYPLLRDCSDRLRSEFQRRVIELYYYHAVSWGEVAKKLYGKDDASNRHNCHATRCNAMASMKRMFDDWSEE